VCVCGVNYSFGIINFLNNFTHSRTHTNTHESDYNLVIELVTRTDLERNKLADVVVSSFNAVAVVDDNDVAAAVADAAAVPASTAAVVDDEDGDDGLQLADRFVIMIGWHISVMGRVVLALSADLVVNDRHLAMSKFKSFRCAAKPGANGNGTNRCST